MRILNGFIGKFYVFLTAAAGLLIAAAGVLVLPAVAAAAATCPAVDPSTGAVSPAPAPGVDWSGCDLTGANLTGADLSNADLSSANLSTATLTGANLTGADLNHVSSGSLTGEPASLPTNWSVTSGFLFGPTANLAGANLTGVRFGNSDLEQASLQDAKLADADLGAADMSQANLDGVTSGGVVVSMSRLPAGWSVENGFMVGPGANLDGANLADLSFTHYFLSGIQLANADLKNTGFSSASLAGADLSHADLSNANLTSASLTNADISGANFSGVSLAGIVSGQITGTPLNLPAAWQLLNGYLIGPGATLVNAELKGVTFDNADLFTADLNQADLLGTTWSSTICPDGTNSDTDGGTCVNNLSMPVNAPPVPYPTIAGRLGANGWYTSAVTVTWNWTAAGPINTAKCTSTSTSTGEGPVTLSASCATVQGLTATAVQHVRIDTIAPKVRVTGVANGKVYPLGRVPRPGCTTTDSVSGVAIAATVRVLGNSSHGTGSFAATCLSAMNNAGLTSGAVTVHYSVGYRFGGFAAPKPGSTLPKDRRTIAVSFRLANASGHAIPAKWAAALARARKVRIAFSGPGISRVTAVCAWEAKTKDFHCSVKVPASARIKTGKSVKYVITAQERLGTSFVRIPG